MKIHYHFSDSDSTIIASLERIEPPSRSETFCGFESGGVTGFRDQETFDSIKNKMETGYQLPPIEVYLAENGNYQVKDGYHRFYISKILGFIEIPVNVVSQPFVFEI